MKLFIISIILFFTSHNIMAFDKYSVQFIDRIGNNWLFRGNSPLSNDVFQYSDLYEAIKNESKNAKGVIMPDSLFIVDINLLLSSSNDIKTEFTFFQKYPDLGELFNWPLFGIPDTIKVKVFGKVVDNVLPNNGKLFELLYDYENYYPQHVSLLIDLMHKVYKNPRIFYIHCGVACDRVSEIIGAYRMYSMGMNLLDSYKITSSECGGMHYFSKSALEWYCYYMRSHNKQNGRCILD